MKETRSQPLWFERIGYRDPLCPSIFRRLLDISRIDYQLRGDHSARRCTKTPFKMFALCQRDPCHLLPFRPSFGSLHPAKWDNEQRFQACRARFVPDVIVLRIQKLVVRLDHVTSLILRDRGEILLARRKADETLGTKSLIVPLTRLLGECLWRSPYDS